MGCASSTPMIGGGGIVGAAKHAAGDVVHAGEDALHEVGDSLNGQIGQVKEAMVGAVHGIGQGLDGVLHTSTDGVKSIIKNGSDAAAKASGTTESGVEYTHIPLKDPDGTGNAQAQAEFKQALLQKSIEMDDDADTQGVDELIKETADMAVTDVPDALDAVLAESMMAMDDVKEGDDVANRNLTQETNAHDVDVKNVDDANSLDSLRTSSPSSEIEKALSNDTRPMVPSPEPTMNELHELEKASAAAIAGEQPSVQQQQLIAKYSQVFNEAQRTAFLRQQKLQISNRMPSYDPDDSNNNPTTSDYTADIEPTVIAASDAEMSGGDDGEDRREPSTDTHQQQQQHVSCGLTQWELLADAILATPVTRFIENPPVNNNGTTEGILEI